MLETSEFPLKDVRPAYVGSCVTVSKSLEKKNEKSLKLLPRADVERSARHLRVLVVHSNVVPHSATTKSF